MMTYEAGLTILEVSDRVRGQNTGYESPGSKINMVILTNCYGLFSEDKERVLFKKTSILVTAQKH